VLHVVCFILAWILDSLFRIILLVFPFIVYMDVHVYTNYVVNLIVHDALKIVETNLGNDFQKLKRQLDARASSGSGATRTFKL